MRSFPLNDDEEWFYTRMRLLTKEQQEVIYMLVRQYSAGTSPPCLRTSSGSSATPTAAKSSNKGSLPGSDPGPRSSAHKVLLDT
jgi:hypothetical protein